MKKNRIVLFVVMVMSDLAINSAFFLVDPNIAIFMEKNQMKARLVQKRHPQLFNNEFAC